LTPREHRFCSEHGGRTTATETHKMLKTVIGNDDISRIHVFEWFKYSEGNMRTLQLIQGVDSHHLLKIQKQLLKYMNWWSESGG
jgi:hypothetical protein